MTDIRYLATLWRRKIRRILVVSESRCYVTVRGPSGKTKKYKKESKGERVFVLFEEASQWMLDYFDQQRRNMAMAVKAYDKALAEIQAIREKDCTGPTVKLDA